MTRPMHQDAAASAAETVLRRTMVLLLLLLMFSSSSFPSFTAECPDECSCKEKLTFFCPECPDKCLCYAETVSCISQGLDRLPDRTPPATKMLYLVRNKIMDTESLVHLTKLQILDLSYNEIRDIESLVHLTELQTLDLSNNEIRDIESLAHLTQLQFLDLSYNEMRDIEPKSFTHLTELVTLNLGNNNISEVKNGAFSNLSKLQFLYLRGNKIEKIEIGVFNNLTSLNELHLYVNQIHNLDLEMFKGLTKLNSLYLGNNMISNIPPGIFDSLTSLSILELDLNPLKCDCNILLFVNALKKSFPEGTLELIGSCVPLYRYPVEIHPKLLVEITENDFNCTSPDVIVVPENKTVLVGEQLQLSCKALGDPEPFITWAKDDIDLELGQRVQVLQNNTLIISKVERTDGGQYKCVASNSFGRKSFEAMVSVNGLAENGCNTMFGVIPGFFFIIIILANCLLYNDIL